MARKPTLEARIALFRKLALSLEGATESAHMGHPDFRLNDRIFATLSNQQNGCGVLKLTTEQQQSFITEQPRSFSPVQGGWGRMGMTYIHLTEADETLIAGALETAYRNLQKKQAQKKAAKTPGKSAKAPRPSSQHLQ